MNTDTRNALRRMAAQKFPQNEKAPTFRSQPTALGAGEQPGRLPAGVQPLQRAPRPGTGAWPKRLTPLVAAAAVVLAVGGVGTWWVTGPGSLGVQPAATGAVGAATTTTTTTNDPTRTSAPTISPVPASTPTGRYLPPQTPAALAATLSKVLAGTATVRVTDTPPSGASAPSQTGAPSTLVAATVPPLPVVPGDPPAAAQPGGPPLPVPAPTQPTPNPMDGAGIVGTITSSDGTSGGFILNVSGGAQRTDSGCTGDVTDCTVTDRPDGSTLAVGLWQDRSVPGGTTYEVHLVRPDGANILLLLSTESDPKGQSTVLADHAPLTITQMSDLAASDQW